MKNRALHAGIKRSPYEAMFGFPPRVGLESTNLPVDVYRSLLTEEELEAVIQSVIFVMFFYSCFLFI